MSIQDDTTAAHPVNYQYECAHCSSITVIPGDAEYSYEDDYCGCGEAFFTSPREEMDEIIDQPAEQEQQPAYFRHKVYSREGGINRSLCGHIRSSEESDRIIAELGDRWNDCPPCHPCESMAETERDLKRSREREKKALQLARYLLDHMDERGIDF